MRMLPSMTSFRTSILACLAIASLGALPALRAQGAPQLQEVAAVELPDAPGSVSVAPAAATETMDFGNFAPQMTARKYHRTVKPGQVALPLSAGDKFKLSVMTQLTLTNLGGNLFSAGLSHVRDGRPHYGVDSGAFGQRLGALSLKGASQNFFSYGLYASAFHEDPRYYVMGPGHKLQKRAIYSASRVVITRKDNGDATINWAKMGGVASGAALANAYYPERDRGATNTIYSILGSLGTAALTNELNEFIGDAMHMIRHKK